MKLAAGRFELDTATGAVTGPKSYMENPNGYARCLLAINEGRNAITTSGYQTNTYMAVLVALQIDYAGWKGQQEMMAWDS